MKQTMTRSPLKGAKKDATSAYFKEVARDLIAENGFENISVEDIAREAGASRSTFYLHFSSKTDILSQILSDDLDRQVGIFRKLTEQPAVDIPAIREWLIAYRDDVESRQSFVRLYNMVIHFHTDGGSILREHRDRCMAILGERFEAFRLDGEDRELAERRRAAGWSLILMIERVLVTFSMTPEGPKLEYGLDFLAETVCAYIEHRIGSGRPTPDAS